jgi:Ion channel
VRTAALAIGTGLIATILWDAFETVVLPRSVSRRLRLTAAYYRMTWRPWAAMARWFDSDARRERFLAIYGPMSLIGLSVVWALGLLLGFAVVHWGFGSKLLVQQTGPTRFVDDLYMSGTTLFTLGLGDVRPSAAIARALTVIEAGLGFAFLAIVIAYLPVLYQSFAKREVRLTLLDAWAGSPPAGAEVLLRLARAGDLDALDGFLKDWEYWCSEVLESHISYPATAYFRSQHQRQSWVSALSTVLDVSALVAVGIDRIPRWQARVTFAIARHTVVDLTQVLHARAEMNVDRLSGDGLERLRRDLEDVGLRPDRSPEAEAELTRLRRSYEPYILGLAKRLMMPASQWRHETSSRDNWQTSPKGDGGGHM